MRWVEKTRMLRKVPRPAHREFVGADGRARVQCRWCGADVLKSGLQSHLKSQTCQHARRTFKAKAKLREQGFDIGSLGFVEKQVLDMLLKRLGERSALREDQICPRTYEVNGVLPWVREYMKLRPETEEMGMDWQKLTSNRLGQLALTQHTPAEELFPPKVWEQYQAKVREWRRVLEESLVQGKPTEEMEARLALFALAEEAKGLSGESWRRRRPGSRW